MAESRELWNRIRPLADYYRLEPEIINSLAALSMARARTLGDYLCIALDTTGIPVQWREDISSRRYSSDGNLLHWEPADRTSRRSVRIVIHLKEEGVSEG